MTVEAGGTLAREGWALVRQMLDDLTATIEADAETELELLEGLRVLGRVDRALLRALARRRPRRPVALQHEHPAPPRRRPQPRRRVPARDDRRTPPLPAARPPGHHRLPRVPGPGRCRPDPAPHGRPPVRPRPRRRAPTAPFAVVLAAAEPTATELAGATWLPIPEDASAIVVREYVGRPGHARCPPRLTLDAARPGAGPPPLPTDAVPRRAAHRLGLDDRQARHPPPHASSPSSSTCPTSSSPPRRPTSGGADTTPTTSTCSARSASRPDEALVIDLDPPATRYWSVTLENIWHECLEPRRRRSSITNAAAVVGARRHGCAWSSPPPTPACPTGSTPAAATAAS